MDVPTDVRNVKRHQTISITIIIVYKNYRLIRRFFVSCNSFDVLEYFLTVGRTAKFQ